MWSDRGGIWAFRVFRLPQPPRQASGVVPEVRFGRIDRRIREVTSRLDAFCAVVIERGQAVITVTFRSEATSVGSEHSSGRNTDWTASCDKLAARFAAQAVASWWDEAISRRMPRVADLLPVVEGC